MEKSWDPVGGERSDEAGAGTEQGQGGQDFTRKEDEKARKAREKASKKAAMKLKVKYLKYDWTSDAKPNCFKKFDRWSFGAFSR